MKHHASAALIIGLIVLASGPVGGPGIGWAEDSVARSYELDIEGMT